MNPYTLLSIAIATASWFASVTVADEPASECRRLLKVITTTDPDQPDRPSDAPRDEKARAWLGVQLGEVPAPLAAQLALQDKGLLIVNVAEGGPADKAGVRRWDIITAAGGETARDIPAFADAVAAKGPDAQLDLTIIREGKEQTLSVTLGSKPADVAWKHDWEPQTRVEERVDAFAKLLQRDPAGQWTWKDLGSLDQTLGLPPGIRQYLPGFDGIKTRIYSDDDRERIKLEVVRDGQTVSIERKDDGRITIGRTTRKGDDQVTEEKTYDNEDALRQGDEDAYGIYSRMRDSHAFMFHGPSRSDSRRRTDLLDHYRNLTKDRAKWQEEIGAKLEEAQKAFEEARERCQALRGHLGDFESPAPPAVPDRPIHTFRVQPDGRIEVTTRKGNSELVQVFTNELELKDRAPELHRKLTETRSVPAD